MESRLSEHHHARAARERARARNRRGTARNEERGTRSGGWLGGVGISEHLPNTQGWTDRWGMAGTSSMDHIAVGSWCDCVHHLKELVDVAHFFAEGSYRRGASCLRKAHAIHFMACVLGRLLSLEEHFKSSRLGILRSSSGCSRTLGSSGPSGSTNCTSA